MSVNERKTGWGGLPAWLALYLDDLLTAGAGVCFTAAAATAWGLSAALAVAGACLLGCGVLVGRARNRR